MNEGEEPRKKAMKTIEERHGRIAAPLSVALLLALSGGCGQKPANPGICKLNCSGAVVASNDLVFSLRATTTNVALSCTAPGNFQRPIEAKFQIVQNTGSQEAPRPTPVPAASIAPIVYGDLAPVADPNPEDIYQGILTPKSDWCTDTCGVVTLQLLPLCPATGQVTTTTIAMTSGPLSSDQNFAFTVESK